MLIASIAALVLTSCVDVAPQDAQKQGLKFHVAVRDELSLDEDQDMRVVLSLTNVGTQPEYVSPVIGQMCQSLVIQAQRVGAERSNLLYDRLRMRLSFGFSDLFRLEPNRRLELEMDIHYSDAFTDEGTYDVWAELDCTGNNEVVPEAFSGKLTSNKARFVLTKKATQPAQR